MDTNRWPNSRHGLLLALLFLATAGWTWGAWAKPGLGFGNSLHRAERIANGITPYQDLALQDPPLGPVVLAALFSIFGAHLNVAYLSGIVILLGQSIVLWRIARHFSSELEASIGVIGFWFLFAFGTGASNWITPASFGAPLGMLLATTALDLLLREARQPSRRNLIIAGCLLGLSALANLVYGAAAMLATLLFARVRPPTPDAVRKGMSRAGILPWILGPALGAMALILIFPAGGVPFESMIEDLFPQTGERAGIWAILGPLHPMWSERGALGTTRTVLFALAGCLVVLPLFAAASLPGIGALRGHAAEKTGAVFLLLPPAIGIALASRLVGPAGGNSLDWATVVWLGVALSAFGGRDRFAPTPAWQALAVIGLFTFAAQVGRPEGGGPDHAGVFTPALVVFLVGITARRLLPDSPRGEHAAAFALLVWIAAGAAPHLQEYHKRDFAVVHDRGTVRMTRFEARPLLGILRRIQEFGEPGQSIAVLPDTALINFLSGRPNPLRSFGTGWPDSPRKEMDFVASMAREDVSLAILRKDALGPTFRTTLGPEGQRTATLLALRFEPKFENRHYILFSPRGRIPSSVGMERER